MYENSEEDYLDESCNQDDSQNEEFGTRSLESNSGSREEAADVYNLVAECISDDDSGDEDEEEQIAEDWNEKIQNYLYSDVMPIPQSSMPLPPPPNLPWFQEPKINSSTEDEEENARFITAMANSRRVQSALDWCADESSQSDDDESEISDESRVKFPLNPANVLADLDIELHLQEIRQPYEQKISDLENELENLTREAAMLGAESLSRQAAATLQPSTEEARRESLRPRRNPRLEDAYTSYTHEAYRQYQKISVQAASY